MIFFFFDKFPVQYVLLLIQDSAVGFLGISQMFNK